jgi:hypothetical protein
MWWDGQGKFRLDMLKLIPVNDFPRKQTSVPMLNYAAIHETKLPHSSYETTQS